MTAKARRIIRLWLPAIILGGLLYALPGITTQTINGLGFLGLSLILTGASAVVLEAR